MNNKRPAVAYRDTNGSGFGIHGVPWVLDGFDSVDSAVITSRRLLKEGFLSAFPFWITDNDNDEPLEITDEYVSSHLIT